MRRYFFTINVLSSLIVAFTIGCNIGDQKLPEIDDPLVIKYALDRSGSIYSNRLSPPSRIVAAETTLREMDELDDSGSYGPGQLGLDEPMYYFAFRVEYRQHGHGIEPEDRIGWLSTTFEIATGRTRSGGGGPDYQHLSGIVELDIPDGLEELVVEKSEIFPLEDKPAPVATAAPPATSAPSAP